jgi:hypothetical protein
VRAVSVALRDPVDLDDVCRGDGLLFVRDGVGVAGRDVVARFEDPAELAAIDHDDRAGGGGVVAFATLPLDPAGAPCILVPGMCVTRRADGAAVLTVVDEDQPDVDAALAWLASSVTAPRPSAGGFDVRPLSPVPRYLDAVAAAREAVQSGSIAKAVIAREVQVTAERPLDVHAILLRLRASFGSSYRYCVDGLIGASPATPTPTPVRRPNWWPAPRTRSSTEWSSTRSTTPCSPTAATSTGRPSRRC